MFLIVDCKMFIFDIHIICNLIVKSLFDGEYIEHKWFCHRKNGEIVCPMFLWNILRFDDNKCN